MILEKIRLLNFNNYTEQELEFGAGINCLTGPNGSGKTNMLDAIYFLALTKSAFNKTDSQTIKHGEAFFLAAARFNAGNEGIDLQCSYKASDKKSIKYNQVAYTRLSDHIGKVPVVLATPDDTDLIREGGEERRKFFDGILSQTDHEYLEHLMRYNAFLQQRNSYLKACIETRRPDFTLIDAYDAHLTPHAEALYKLRKQFASFYEPIFNQHYASLSNGQEMVNLVYNSPMEVEQFRDLLAKARNTDIALGRTTVGPHKDDYIFSLGAHPLKKFGSQGQQKCFVIALKMAQYQAMFQLKGQKPLLLLDDIFDKLDDARITRLLEILHNSNFGQVFITDARPERSQSLLGNFGGDIRFFKVERGVVVPEAG